MQYHVIIKATIEIGGTFNAESAELAQEAAARELRSHGEVTDITPVQTILLHEEGPYGLSAA